jgi:hypothetical protein
MSSVQLATSETEFKGKKKKSTLADQQPPVKVLSPATELKDKKEDVKVLSPFRVLLLGLLLVGTGAAGFYSLPGRYWKPRKPQCPCLISHTSIRLATSIVPGMIKDDAGGSRLVNSIYCSAITLTTYVSRSCLYLILVLTQSRRLHSYLRHAVCVHKELGLYVQRFMPLVSRVMTFVSKAVIALYTG